MLNILVKRHNIFFFVSQNKDISTLRNYILIIFKIRIDVYIKSFSLLQRRLNRRVFCFQIYKTYLDLLTQKVWHAKKIKSAHGGSCRTWNFLSVTIEPRQVCMQLKWQSFFPFQCNTF